MLTASNLSHSFDYPLFENINLSLENGKTTAIVGISGSGKSTILHIMSSFLSPQNGSVTLNDKDIYKLSEDEILQIRRRDFGIIFQSHYLFRGFSGYENIKIAELLSNESLDIGLTEKFGISPVLHQQSSTLSGGQQQRLSIVRVLSKKPKIIFADEPTGNLDKTTATEVMELLFEYITQNNASMLCVTHDEELAMECDNVFRLNNGQLIRIK